jgi:hypothetical protein
MSPFPLGIVAASGVGAAIATSFDLLETKTVSGTTTAIEFTNVNTTYASDYQHLQLRTLIKTNQSDGSGLYANIYIRLNSDSGANYSYHNMAGNGSTRTSAGNAASTVLLDFPGAGNSSTHWTPGIIDIIDPFETTKHTTARALATRFESRTLGQYSGAWYNTAAVATITVSMAQAASFVSGTKVSLYGLKAA